MSGFHPALTGVLYGALAQNEQALAQLQLAANIAQTDVNEATAERYTGIADGLKRLISLAEPPQFGTSVIEHSEKLGRCYVLLGRLMSQLSDFDIWSWNLQGDGVDANLRGGDPGDNGAVRRNMRVVADRIGVEYVEKRHGRTGPTLIVCAKGEIDGIKVRIYDLIEAERPICDIHHVMVDADGVCLECPIEGATETDDGGAWNDPAVRRAVRETIAEGGAQ